MLKLGKLAPLHDRRMLKFKDFRRPAYLPKPPCSFGNEQLVSEWGMLGNNTAGDCVFAGAAHEHMVFCAVAGTKTEFKTEDVLKGYSDVTGYIPGDDSTDNGTYTLEALKYRKSTGIRDTKGDLHKIGAYVSLEPGNTDELYEALYLFEAVGIGIQFPETAMSQFDKGLPWTIVKGAHIEGGHYIPLVAKRHRRLKCVTWAKVQEMTLSFYRKYCDESWLILSEDMLKNGKSQEGFDMAGLKQAMIDVGSSTPG